MAWLGVRRVGALWAARVVAMVMLVASAATAGDASSPDPASGPLDGMTFIGKIGPAGRPDVDDILYFDNGYFWSEACSRCGFAPGIYWVRHVEDGIAFHGVLESRERGSFSYSGVVRDGRIAVTIDWQRDRWYWSMRRKLGFEGVLTQRSDLAMTLAAAQLAAAGELADPALCPR